MREIKFRFWDKKDKKMYVQGEADLKTLKSFIFHYGDQELMQFTGLYDKSGKEIYEGDLFRVKDTYHSILSQTSFKRDTIFEVVYDKTGFVLKVVKSDTEHLGNRIGSYQRGNLIYFEGEEHKIIGNIHENPEFLEI